MTKISQLTDIGASLAANDEFIIRDVSDASTPNKKVTSSGLIDYVIAQGAVSGFTQIAAGVGPLARALASSSGATGTLTFSTASATTLVERARIDSSGRLLVGTSTSDGQRFASVQIASAGGQSGWGSSANLSEFGASYNPWISLQRSRNGTIGSHTVLQNGDNIGGIAFNGSDGDSFESAATINAFVDGTPGAGDMPGRLVFSTTADGASSPTERMRIDSSGRLLVGTSTGSSAIRSYFAGNGWGGGTGSNTVTGLSTPQFLFDGLGLDNSGSVLPIGFQLIGGGGGVPRGFPLGVYGRYAISGDVHMFFVSNTGNVPYGTLNATPCAGVYMGASDAYGSPAATAWWSQSMSAAFGIKDVRLGMYDGGNRVGQTIELGGTYGGGNPGAWGGTCSAVRINTNFGSGSTGSNIGYYADITNAGSGGNWGLYIANGGAAKPGGGSFTATSDARVKNVVGIYARGLQEVTQLNPVRFVYNGRGETPMDGKECTGLIAQEARQIIPEIVSSRLGKLNEDDENQVEILMVDPSDLVFALVNACKELKTEVDVLKAKVLILETA